jgi:hypothetical protein
MNTRLVALLLALVPALVSAQGADAQMAGSKMLENSAGSRAKMKAKLKYVLDRMEQARNEKDVLRLNCLNEKVSQMKALVRVADQADLSLHEAVAVPGGGASESEYVKIEIARRKVETLARDADACAASAGALADEGTRVEVEAPAAVAEADAARRMAVGYGAVPPPALAFEMIDRGPLPGWTAPPGPLAP